MSPEISLSSGSLEKAEAEEAGGNTGEGECRSR